MLRSTSLRLAVLYTLGVALSVVLLGASLIGPVLPASDPGVAGEFYTTAGAVMQSAG